jgi:hypothetical protein
MPTPSDGNKTDSPIDPTDTLSTGFFAAKANEIISAGQLHNGNSRVGTGAVMSRERYALW